MYFTAFYSLLAELCHTSTCPVKGVELQEARLRDNKNQEAPNQHDLTRSGQVKRTSGLPDETAALSQ